MEDLSLKFSDLIKNASSILVTSHISPDPDAVSSSLLLSETLKDNLPDKQLVLALEEKPDKDISFLQGYSSIIFGTLSESVASAKPDLIIMMDANKLSRCSRQEVQLPSGLKTIIIDHHEPLDKDNADLYINSGYPAATQEVYTLLFNQLNMNKPAGYADTAMLGIVSDTYRFKYKNPKHRETFAIVSELIDAGADIESLENRINKYTAGELSLLAELAKNLQVENDYNYSYVSDEFTSQWLQDNKPAADYKGGVELFVNEYIRSVSPNSWGFIVYGDIAAGPNAYSVSFRAEGNVKDVAAIAQKLGGGGHKPAAGAKFKAAHMAEAVNKVKAALE